MNAGLKNVAKFTAKFIRINFFYDVSGVSLEASLVYTASTGNSFSIFIFI